MRALWDGHAETFDEEPDHGLNDPRTRRAWELLLDGFLGSSQGAVVDLGCGTGSLSLLLAERGHQVLGVDIAPRMVERAQAKTSGAEHRIEFLVGDVQLMPVPTRKFSAVLSRHVLWTVPDPSECVARWSGCLEDDGMFVAVEGVWNGAGLAPGDAFSILQGHFEKVEYTDLAAQADLWGKSVNDERYAMVALNPRRKPRS